MTQFIGQEVKSDKVLSVLNQIVDLGGDTSPAMREIAGFMENQVRLGFRQSRSPYGEVWAPVARGGKPLIDNRTLLGSITSQHGRDFAEVGTNIEYAAIHHFGGRTGRNHATTITARPYMPIVDDEVVLPPAWEDRVVDVLGRILEQITK